LGLLEVYTHAVRGDIARLAWLHHGAIQADDPAANGHAPARRGTLLGKRSCFFRSDKCHRSSSEADPGASPCSTGDVPMKGESS
jgi:hypothetical protein